MSIVSTIHEIRATLDRLRALRLSNRVFGSEVHGFLLGATLSENEVQQFEDKHGVQLPEDYRQFLIKIGNGGAGSHYGVFKLGEMDIDYGQGKWHEGDGFVGVLSKPFPHVEAWNDLPLLPEDTEDDAYDEAVIAFDKI